MRKLCIHPGCKNTFEGKGWYCPEHKKVYQTRKYSKTTAKGLDTNMDFYNSSAWRSLSKSHRINYPMCEHCGRRLAAAVDHHLELSLDPNRNFARSRDNFVSVCNPCHLSKTRQIQELIKKGDINKIRDYLLIEHPRREDAEYLKDCEIIIHVE
ncbi:hypothetical protein [Aeromonas dhakensis]|uniref:hypothetical protein n=1 Tax=Aeromonas dhakensis TaxID=196024 RepID=UPI002B4A2A3A|nr:hypothetical protein [Aeromonas dhakensis]